jgi:hypothetical protein
VLRRALPVGRHVRNVTPAHFAQRNQENLIGRPPCRRRSLCFRPSCLKFASHRRMYLGLRIQAGNPRSSSPRQSTCDCARANAERRSTETVQSCIARPQLEDCVENRVQQKRAHNFGVLNDFFCFLRASFGAMPLGIDVCNLPRAANREVHRRLFQRVRATIVRDGDECKSDCFIGLPRASFLDGVGRIINVTRRGRSTESRRRY